MKQDTRDMLLLVSTPTLTTAMFKHGFRNVFLQGPQRPPRPGCILATRLQSRGCRGIVTDGGFRDTPEFSALAMPAKHTRPSAPTNLTKHHAVAVNDPIACGWRAVFPGDVIVGDSEGVVCIPAHMADMIAVEASEMTVFEDFVLEEVQGGASTFGLYPPTDPATKDRFDTWRKANNR